MQQLQPSSSGAKAECVFPYIYMYIHSVVHPPAQFFNHINDFNFFANSKCTQSDKLSLYPDSFADYYNDKRVFIIYEFFICTILCSRFYCGRILFPSMNTNLFC